MSFVEQDTAVLTSVRYSSFLGKIYLATPEAEDAIKAVKAEIGEAEVKKGFTGNTGNSAKALAALKERGVRFGRLRGALTGARVLMRDIQGRQMPYLSVTVTGDEGEKTNLSIALSQKGAQMLVRKLVNAQPGVLSEISLFASYGKREGAERAYAEHGASLRQGGPVEVPGVNPRDALQPAIAAAVAALKQAGIDDKEVLSKKRSSIELDYHVQLMQQVTDKFNSFYASTGDSHHESDDHGDPQGDPDADIPF
jgi:hypothetical protein